MYPNLVTYNPGNRERKPAKAGKLLGYLNYKMPNGASTVHVHVSTDGKEELALAEFNKLKNPPKSNWSGF